MSADEQNIIKFLYLKKNPWGFIQKYLSQVSEALWTFLHISL